MYIVPIQGFPNACYADQERAKKTGDAGGSDPVKAIHRAINTEKHNEEDHEEDEDEEEGDVKKKMVDCSENDGDCNEDKDDCSDDYEECKSDADCCQGLSCLPSTQFTFVCLSYQSNQKSLQKWWCWWYVDANA